MKTRIEQEMAALDPSDFRRIGCSLDDYMKGISRLLAQATLDQAVLEGAGFSFEALMSKFYGYLEMLALEHAERVNAETENGEARKVFSEKMPLSEQHKKILMCAARFVVEKSLSDEPRQIYNLIRKGRGQVDTLNDNIALVGFCTKHREIVSQINPGGQVITETFLSAVERNAIELLKLRGEAENGKGEMARRVDRQNRLITLLILAEREIKLYADAAFVDDNDRYNRDYARQYRRTSSSDSGPDQDTSQAI